MRIFSWISLSNFCFMWPTFFTSFICDLHLNELYEFSTGFGLVTSIDALESLMVSVPF